MGSHAGFEDFLEPAVTKHLGPPAGLGQGVGEAGHSAGVVAGAGRYDHHGQEQSEGVDDPEALAAGDLLAGVISPGGAAHGGGATYAAGVDDAHRRVGVMSFLGSDQLAEPVDDALPGAVSAPAHVIAVHRAPVRVAVRQSPPLAAGGGHVQDGVHDGASVVNIGPADLSFAGEGRDQIGYKFPLGVGQITVSATPSRSIYFAAVLDDSIISPDRTRDQQNRPQPATILWTASEGYLYGITCTSSTFCTTIGNDPFIWNGTDWTSTSAELPGDPYYVSCTSSTWCVAPISGAIDGAQEGYATWNGTTWTSGTDSIPVPNGANSVYLGAVSCPVASECITIGDSNVIGPPVVTSPLTELFQTGGGGMFTPSLSTEATSSSTLGATISDSALLSGASPNAAGTITFTAYSDAACSTQAFTTSPIPVSGDGSYASTAGGTFTPGATGTYYWVTSYSGDTGNMPVEEACHSVDESSMVVPPASLGPPSSTWAGYVLTTSHSSPATADIVVPAVRSTSCSELEKSAFWVGLNGYTDPDSSYLPQVGFDADCIPKGASEKCSSNPGADYFLWWEINPHKSASHHDICSFPIVPGDAVSLSVIPNGSTVVLTATSTNTAGKSVSWSQPMPVSESDRHETSSECIVEDPQTGSPTSPVFPFTDFGTVTFSGCSSISDYLPHSTSLTYLNMWTLTKPRHPKATTSTIAMTDNNVNVFTVGWDPST